MAHIDDIDLKPVIVRVLENEYEGMVAAAGEIADKASRAAEKAMGLARIEAAFAICNAAIAIVSAYRHHVMACIMAVGSVTLLGGIAYHCMSLAETYRRQRDVSRAHIRGAAMLLQRFGFETERKL